MNRLAALLAAPRVVTLLLLTVAPLAIGCGSKDSTPSGDAPPRVVVGHPRNAELPADFVCPGAAACPPSDDPTLYAAAAIEKVTPTITETLTHSASGKTWEYRAAGGDTFSDANGNGKFDAVWMGGFDPGRAASGVDSDQQVRSMVLRQGNTTIAFVTIDCIGFMYDELQRIRDALAAAKVPVSYVLMNSSHVHEAQDTLGIWGVDAATSGLDRSYNAKIRDAAVRTVVAAIGKLEKANVTFSSIDVDGHLPGTDPLHNGAKAFVSDGRDPVVIDLKMNTMRLSRPSDKSTIATVVNWAAHPESAGHQNTLLSSDYVDALRTGVETGVDLGGGVKKDGVGGVALFFEGALGGQIGPGQVIVADATGQTFDQANDSKPTIGLARAHQWGRNFAYYALASLEPGSGASTYESARLGVRARQIYGRIDNREYHVAIVSKLFDRKAYHFDESQPISASNTPDILSEVAIVDVGPATMVTAPGELFPELYLGGYDGKFTPKGYDLVQTDPAHCKDPKSTGYRGCNASPPALSKAPKDGYLWDLVDKGAKYKWLLGLTNDMLGYIVPSYDYVLDPDDPYYKEPPGDHYEETNSIGARCEADLVDPIRDLLKTQVPITRP